MLLAYIPLGTSKFIFFEYADVPWYTSVILCDWYSDFSKKTWIKNQDLAFKSHSVHMVTKPISSQMHFSKNNTM